jgi:hypothetical protein
MNDWQDYDTDGDLMLHDEGGITSYLGYSSTTAWGLCKFVMTDSVDITRVEFWAGDRTTDVDLSIYDDFDGSNPSNLLASELNQAFEHAGYHSIELSSPVSLNTGEDVFVVMKLTNESYAYPLPIDANSVPGHGPSTVATCYASASGSGWSDIGPSWGDLGIRIRVTGGEGSSGGGGTTWRVPDDYPTIQAAVNAASDGDTVAIADGTYTGAGNRDVDFLDKEIIVKSESGNPAACIVECQGSAQDPHRGFLFQSGEGGSSELEGITVRGGYAPDGGGIYCFHSSPTIRACVIADNTASTSGGGLYSIGGSPAIGACTFASNQAFAGSAINGIFFAGITLEATLIAHNSGGAAVGCDGTSSFTLSCCDISSNPGGDWTGRIASEAGTNGNFSEKPLFCDRNAGDYGLQASSPCISGQGCGQVGALGQGCPDRVPEDLASFSAAANDEAVMLRWTLPDDQACEGALIVYSTLGYPPDPHDGSPVENGSSGYFHNAPAAADSFMHGGLANGTTYYYRAYAFNEDWESDGGLAASAVPADDIPPEDATGFAATTLGPDIQVAWTYPDDSDLAGIVVRYSTVAYPEYPLDGDPVENGSSGVFVGSPGTDTCFIHQGLTPEVAHYYTAFAFDEVPNYSTGVGASAAPGDTTPPASVGLFQAEAGDTTVLLRWTNPGDGDFDGTLVRYSTADYPAGPDSGLPVENGALGIFLNQPAAADSFSHTFLVNGTTYYYAAFAFDDAGNCAPGVAADGIPHDGLPPGPPTGFNATAGDTTVTLRWTNPGDADFAFTVVRYSTTAYPTAFDQGMPVPNGAGGIFPNAAASADSFIHTGLSNDTSYYYAAFAADEVPNYSVGSTLVGDPADRVSPSGVADFEAVALDGSAKLRWTATDEPDLAGVLVRYSTVASPANTEDGSPVENGNNGVFPTAPAAADSFVHSGLGNGTTYYYSIFAFDEVPNYSGPAEDDATPRDRTPPGITVSVFQNPMITNHLDIYVMATEPVSDTSVVCLVYGTPVDMAPVGPGGRVYAGDYDIPSSGPMNIHAGAMDLGLNWGETERGFMSAWLAAGSGGAARSADGRLRVQAGEGALERGAYLLISPIKPLGSGLVAAYDISPAGLDLGAPLEIAFKYDATAREPEHLGIVRVEDDGLEPILSCLDRSRREVVGRIDGLGTYGLILDPRRVTPEVAGTHLRALQNVPNPFTGSTKIVFDCPVAGRARVTILGIDGRVVAAIMDRAVSPGRHVAEWDGKDGRGRTVAGGVYLYRVSTGAGSVTRKMVHLR